MRVDGTISFSSSVQPLALGSSFVGGGVNTVMVGFGLLAEESEFSENLQYVTVTTITNADCASRMPDFLIPTITDKILCTFTRAGQGLCFGDSGGPVIAGNAAIGIMSFAMPCAVGYPDGHTRISSHRAWITSVIG